MPKKYLKYVIVGIVIFGLFLYLKISDQRKEKIMEEEEILQSFDDQLATKCENKEWIEFPLFQGTAEEVFVGNAKMQYSKEDETLLPNEDNSLLFFTDKEYIYSLSFFINKETRIEGKRTDANKIYIEKIKCIGPESDVSIKKERQKLMKYISDNINELALEKSPRNDWQVDTFYFTENGDLYVQYESVASWDEEAPFDGRFWLVRPSNFDRPTPNIETLAYIWEDGEDPEKSIVKFGEDIHADDEFLTIYEFDDEIGEWVLQ